MGYFSRTEAPTQWLNLKPNDCSHSDVLAHLAQKAEVKSMVQFNLPLTQNHGIFLNEMVCVLLLLSTESLNYHDYVTNSHVLQAINQGRDLLPYATKNHVGRARSVSPVVWQLTWKCPKLKTKVTSPKHRLQSCDKIADGCGQFSCFIFPWCQLVSRSLKLPDIKDYHNIVSIAAYLWLHHSRLGFD